MSTQRQWVIGRALDCDLWVDQEVVSGRHCRLIQVADGFLLEDLESSNGTFVNGKEVRGRVPVTPADRITLGRGVPMPWPKPGHLSGARPAARPPTAAVAVGFRGHEMVFGRHPTCDQVLDYPMISSRHARLRRHGTALVLEDLGSTNGTFLNGRRVGRAVVVRAGDVIGLGTFTFQVTDEGQLARRDFRGDLALEARGVTVEVPGRRLLEDVSLTLFPSEFVGLMGPSGAGKTTLMNALNGYVPPSAGEVRLNGQDLYEHYNQLAAYIGYVPQDDVLHRELTVRQALCFSARLRLPADCTRADVDRRVAAVLEQLGLKGTENVLVGSPENKGISGGQRKRVNLAMELLTDPLVLFLDEPTSGLSSEDALAVMKLLRRLADAGKTILLTIHQPSLEAFRLLDNLALVARDGHGTEAGRLVYYGPAFPRAIDFFNPGGVPDLKPGAEPVPDHILRGLEKAPARDWHQRYLASDHYRHYVEQRQGQRPPGGRSRTLPRRPSPPALLQWWTLAGRLLAIKARDAWSTAILLAQAPIIACLVVLVYGKEVSQEPDAGHWGDVGNALGSTLFLMALAALWFGCSNSVRDIVGEKAVYRRERMVGLGIVPYVASKFAVLGGLCLVQCLVLLGITAWGCALQGNLAAEFGLLLLVSLVGVGLGLTISAVAPTSEVAIGLVPLVLLPMVMLGGAMLPVHKMPRAGQLACSAMASRWAFEGLLVLECRQRPAAPPSPAAGEAEAEEADSPDMAEVFFPKKDQRRGPGAAAAVLLGMLGVLLTAAHLVLKAKDLH
jgi:ABC-type multidrug transport system ATPase subunit